MIAENYIKVEKHPSGIAVAKVMPMQTLKSGLHKCFFGKQGLCMRDTRQFRHFNRFRTKEQSHWFSGQNVHSSSLPFSSIRPVLAVFLSL